MTRKASALSQFAAKPAPAEAHEVAPKKPKGARGSAERPAIAVRLNRDDWAALHMLAVTERSSLQALIVEGLQMLMKARGVPPITGE